MESHERDQWLAQNLFENMSEDNLREYILKPTVEHIIEYFDEFISHMKEPSQRDLNACQAYKQIKEILASIKPEE